MMSRLNYKKWARISPIILYFLIDGADKSRVPSTEAQWEIPETRIRSDFPGRDNDMYSQMAKFKDTDTASPVENSGLSTYEVLLKATDLTMDVEGYMNHHFMLNRSGFQKGDFSISIVAVTDKNYLKEEQKDLDYVNFFDAENSKDLGRSFRIELMGFEGNLKKFDDGTVQQAGTEYDAWDRCMGLGYLGGYGGFRSRFVGKPCV